MKVVADAVRLGAIGDDGIERLVQYVRQEGGFALSAASDGSSTSTDPSPSGSPSAMCD
jgi:hypothetical protein